MKRSAIGILSVLLMLMLLLTACGIEQNITANPETTVGEVTTDGEETTVAEAPTDGEETTAVEEPTDGEETTAVEEPTDGEETTVAEVTTEDKIIQLAAPVIDRIEDDIVHWIAVDNADMYLVRVNGDYEYKTRSTSCELSSVKNSEGKAISVSAAKKAPVQVNVQVMALMNGQYAASEWSAVDNSYTYVPNYNNESTITTLTGYRIGYGYNLVEDEYLRITNASGSSVFNVSKLLSLGRYNVTPNAAGASTYYSYSSVDEFISKSEAGFDVSMDVKIPMSGTLKAHFNYVGSDYLKNYAYNQTFVADVAVTVEDHELLELREEYLKYCLSFDFLDVLNRRTMATEHMSDAELAAYIYENYGTHVILGVTTGGSYTALYSVSTNEEAIAESLKKVVETGMNVSFDDIFGVDIGVDLTASGEKNWKTQTTEAHFNTRFTGSTGGATFDPSPSSLSSAVKEWQSKISPTSVRFTKNGAISMASILRTVDSGLADAFEAYVEERSDDTYKEMYGQYEKNLTRLIPAPVVENGKNVIYIDLSSFQRSGSMENAYDPNFLENILTIYPVMYGVKVDKIVIRGGFDEATGQQNLIDGFSIKLSKEWNRDVEIVVENLGVICASDYGLVDTSAITKNIRVTVNYSGVNMIQETDGEYHFHAQNGDKYYEFYFDPVNTDGMEFTTVSMEDGRLVIPIANRNSYSFVGWYAGDTQVTDASGALLSSYTAFGERVMLTAKWDASTYTITLNDQSATVPGTEKFYEKYGAGFFAEFVDGSPIAQITVPSRTGYVFGGYFASVSDNATANAIGTSQYINEKGEIIREPNSFTENTMLYALWLPTVYTITLDANGATDAGSSAYYEQYGNGVYLDENCTQVGTIQIPTKQGYTFAGYYVSVTDNNTTNAAGHIMCVDASGAIVAENTQFTQDTTLHALWTQKIVIIYDANGGTGTMSQSMCDPDETFNLPANVFTKNGFAFAGWKMAGHSEVLDNQATVNNLGAYGATITMVAQWTIIPYTVTWNTSANCTIKVERTSSPNGKAATGVLTSGATVYYGDVLTISYTANTGYTLNTNKGKTSITVSDNVTSSDIYVSATVNTYSIVYDSAGGTSVSKKTFTYGQTTSSPSNPTRTGYAFNGWKFYNADTGASISFAHGNKMPAYNVKAVAQWLKTEGNGGYTSAREKEVSKDSTTTEKYSVGLSRSALQAAGYTKLKITVTVYGYENRLLASIKPIVKIYNRNGSTVMASKEGSNWPEDWGADNMSSQKFVFEVSIDALNDNGQIMVGYSASGGACWLMGVVNINVIATK